VQEKTLDIVNKLGLHARAAAQLVKVAGGFAADVRLARADADGADTVDGKSIMSVMLLAAACGSRIRVTTEGPDEVEALAAIETLVADRFGEAE
jgi:phosphocarrier protein